MNQLPTGHYTFIMEGRFPAFHVAKAGVRYIWNIPAQMRPFFYLFQFMGR